MAGPAEGPSAVEPRWHRVQLGPAPTTTDLLWPAGLQAAVDLRCILLHGSHFRTRPPASQERLTSILVSDSREIGQTEVHKHNPRPTSRGSEPDEHWLAPRPWAVLGAIGVPTQPGGFFSLATTRATILPTGPRLLRRAETANRHSLKLTKWGSRPQQALD